MQFVDPNLVAEVTAKFGEYGLDVGLVSPTKTAMVKSIMDATGPLRDFLRLKGLHDFSRQEQGEEHKCKLDAYFVFPDSLIKTTISLYRPNTKFGDPRIWIYKLQNYASPDDLLALLEQNGEIYVVNASSRPLLASIDDPQSKLGQIAAFEINTLPHVASELLQKLQYIARQGFIPSVRRGDTGVGATLESALGIQANSRKSPDYYGVEIKASRQRRAANRAKNRVTLFSQVPDWKYPNSTNAKTTLFEYGYEVDGRQQLYCTISSLEPNSQGLMLSVDSEMKFISIIDFQKNKRLMTWSLDSLRDRLKEKHPESFWVKADYQLDQFNNEFFHYHTAEYTSNPLEVNFATALSSGIITLDLTLSDKPGKAVRDHGYLFRMWPSDLSSIFPATRSFDLLL